jgi:AAA family ATP:ADP antiporter
VLQLVSLRLAHALIPLVHLGAGLALLLRPSLWTGSLAFLLFKSIDYSVFRAAKEILYIPLPYDARYRSKELIDAVGYRVGKGGASALLAAATRWLGTLPGSTLALAAVAAELVWLPLVLAMTRSRPAPRAE